MNRLFSVEAERVLQVLDSAADSISLLSKVPATADEDVLDILHERGSEDVVAQLQSQWRLEESKAVVSRPSTERGSRLEGARAGTAAADRIRESLSAETRRLVRTLMANSGAARELRHYAASGWGGSAGMASFLTVLAQVKSMARHRLAQSHEDRLLRSEHLEELSAKTVGQQEERKAKEAELWVARKKQQEEADEVEAIRSKLQGELDTLTASVEAAEAHLQKSTTSQRQSDQERHEQRMAALRLRVAELEKEMAAQLEKMEDEENLCRKKKNKVRHELKSVVDRYDAEMQKRQDEIAEINESYEVEKEQLERLHEHFRKVQRNLSREAQEEAELERQRAARAAKDQELYGGAAVKLQAVWKGHHTRKNLDSLIPQRKKGKGKKGKKGGKKGKGKSKKKKKK